MNVAHLISWSAQQHADRLAFVQDDVTRTYAEVERRANRFDMACAPSASKPATVSAC